MGCKIDYDCEKYFKCFHESDNQISFAFSMSQLINVMENKLIRCIKEKSEITEYLNGNIHYMNLVDQGTLSKEDLSKRIPYLEKFSICYYLLCRNN